MKLIIADGWYLHRNGSRHDVYRHRVKEGQVIIARHKSKELAKGTEKSILKTAGLL